MAELWLETEVCLMNKPEQEAHKAGTLAVDLVHMLRMIIKVDTGCSELALNKVLIEKLNLDYAGTIKVSSPTDIGVDVDRYGPVLIHWNGLVTDAFALCMPLLDSPLLGLKPLLIFRPDINWKSSNLTRGIASYLHKRYYLDFSDIEKVIGTGDKIDYFAKEHGVKLHVMNEGGCKMILVICALRLDVDIDQVAQTVAHFAPSLSPL